LLKIKYWNDKIDEKQAEKKRMEMEIGK